MVLLRCLLLSLLAALAWAQEPEPEPVSPTVSKPESVSPTMSKPEPEPQPADIANPLVTGMDSEMITEVTTPPTMNETMHMMNSTVTTPTEPTQANITTQAPAAAPQVAALSAAALCLISALVVS